MKRAVLASLLLLAVPLLPAALNTASPVSNDVSETYRLMIRDQITVNVYGQPDMGAESTIGLSGTIRIPLLEEVQLNGLTVREAEKKLEQLYVEKELLKKPTVSVRIISYAKREVMILGPGVTNPGALPFPPEIASMDILEAISKVGGFRGIARSDEVKVIRQTPRGTETEIVDVKRMMERGTTNRFLLYPGDQVYVRDRLW